MKNGMSKLLSALLIATLVFTSAGVAFAGTGESGAKAEIKAEAQKTQSLAGFKSADFGKQMKKQAAEVKAAETKSVGTIAVKTLVTGNETAPAATIGYSSPANSIGYGKYGFHQSVSLPEKGTLILAAYNAPQSTDYANFGLFSDPALTNQIASGNYYGSVNKGESKGVAYKVPAAGTYYIGAYSTDFTSSPQVTVTLNMSAGFISGSDRAIAGGATIAVGQRDAQTNYFKFKATKTGYLKVVKNNELGKVTLCNSKKKALSNTSSTSYTPTYGVKKGSTYYIKVASSYSSNGGYQLKATNTKITEKSGKKKSKAVTIKKKKTKKGTIIAGSGQADWYKFKLGSKKKVTVTMKGGTNNKLKVIVYNQKGKKVGSANTFNYFNSKLTLKSYTELAKGTYYIKVYRGTKTSSGWYSLYWK